MAVTLLGMFMAVLDGMIIGIALPTITGYFNADIALSQWTMTAYLVAMTSTMLIFGKLSEYTGKERMFLAGIAVFTAGSLGCALVPTLPLLILMRVVQGIGAAMAVSIAMAIIIGLFPYKEHGKAMGALGATIGIASLMGPVLGGFLTDLAGWQSIFLINIPLGVILLLIGIWSMNLKKPASGELKMDRAGAAGLILGISGLIFLPGTIAKGYSDCNATVISGLVCLAGLMIFYISEKKHPEPLLDLSVFSERDFILPVVSMVLFFTVVFMVNVSVPFYLEEAVGFSPSQAGLAFMVIPGVVVVGSPLAGRLYDRYQSKHYTATGLVIAALALSAFAFFAETRDIKLVIPALAVFAAGYALFQSPVNVEIMRGLSPAKSGIASSLSSTGRHFGMALGVAVASVIFSVQFSNAGFNEMFSGAGPEIFEAATTTSMVVAAIICLLATLPLIIRSGKNKGEITFNEYKEV